MRQPIRYAGVAALLLQGLTFIGSGHGAIPLVTGLLAMYFALDFVMLLALSLFSNRAWRLTPGLRWAER